MSKWTPDFKRGYGQGYNTGSKNGWPAHKPPSPLDENVRALIAALRALRDEADCLLATFEENDPVFAQLSRRIDEADNELSRLTEWIFKDEQP